MVKLVSVDVNELSLIFNYACPSEKRGLVSVALPMPASLFNCTGNVSDEDKRDMLKLMHEHITKLKK